MPKFKPSSAQLKETLEHIYYEISQLIGTLIETDNEVMNNALIESRLIHVRALSGFFKKTRSKHYKTNKEQDDVLSSDYGFASQRVGIQDSYKDRLNKDLAHLSYSRAKRQPNDKLWPHDKIVLPVLVCCQQFGEHLISRYLPTNYPDPEKQAKWQELVNSIKATVQEISPKTGR